MVTIHLQLQETTGVYWGNKNIHWEQITEITGPPVIRTKEGKTANRLSTNLQKK